MTRKLTEEQKAERKSEKQSKAIKKAKATKRVVINDDDIDGSIVHKTFRHR